MFTKPIAGLGKILNFSMVFLTFAILSLTSLDMQSLPSTKYLSVYILNNSRAQYTLSPNSVGHDSAIGDSASMSEID